MRRKTLLYAISLFSGLLLIYPFISTLPDLIESWDSISTYTRGHSKIPPEVLRMFLKLFINFILQECFYGAVCLWSYKEAKMTKESKELSDERVAFPKADSKKHSIIPSKREIIIVLLICAGVLLVPVIYIMYLT